MPEGHSVPKFELASDWPDLLAAPAHSNISDVAVDTDDRVYIFARTEPMVVIYSPDGDFLSSWGEESFEGRPHGITLSSDGFAYCVEDWGCTVRKFTLDGKVVAVIGPSGIRSDTGADWNAAGTINRTRTVRHEGGPPYNHPTKLAIGPTGDLYVSDGYGNCKVHRFSSEGRLIQSWGTSGVGPGEFHLPHSILITAQGKVCVSDRENDRIQVFTLDGEYLTEWTGVHRPNCVVQGPDGLFYVGEANVSLGRHSFVHGDAQVALPPRIAVLDESGKFVGEANGINVATDTHGVAVDSKGNLYVADSMTTGRIQKYVKV